MLSREINVQHKIALKKGTGNHYSRNLLVVTDGTEIFTVELGRLPYYCKKSNNSETILKQKCNLSYFGD